MTKKKASLRVTKKRRPRVMKEKRENYSQRAQRSWYRGLPLPTAPEERFTMMAPPEPYPKDDQTQPSPFPCNPGQAPATLFNAVGTFGHISPKLARLPPIDAHQLNAVHQFIV